MNKYESREEREERYDREIKAESEKRRNSFHAQWHQFWAVALSNLGLNKWAASHLDRYLVVAATGLELHVMHPNEDRRGCRLVRVYSEEYD